MNIGIIGGGASGMAAAYAAAQNPDVHVYLFERQSRVGKKLQATGNGRCNLTNVSCGGNHYHGNQPSFPDHALSAFTSEDTLRWFSSLGLYTTVEDSGRVYPYSNHANSVVDVLRYGLERENVHILTGFEVRNISQEEDGFTVYGDGEAQSCNKVIVACGGLAGTKLGGSLSGYRLLRSLGHKSTQLRPALVQIKSDWTGCRALKGVRARCDVKILRNGSQIRENIGELQFTEYGISGPVVFEVSRDVCQGGGKWTCQMDFVPEMSLEELYHAVSKAKSATSVAEDLFLGVLHNRLGRVLSSAAGIPAKKLVCELTHQEIMDACRVVKQLEIRLTDLMGMDCAQVTAGGILTEEFSPETMESRLVPGLYACGEVLDVDGDCGGYNLQWAWSSGMLAGKSAGGLL